jgi:hypothetical protein
MYEIVLILFLIILSLYFFTSSGYTPENFDSLSKSIKQRNCDPNQDPNMYEPRGDCSDPFSWGFLYSTGPNPQVFN